MFGIALDHCCSRPRVDPKFSILSLFHHTCRVCFSQKLSYALRNRREENPATRISHLRKLEMMLTGPEAAARFIKFVNASPTPFHAVQNAALRLEKAGFLKVVHIASLILRYL